MLPYVKNGQNNSVISSAVFLLVLFCIWNCVVVVCIGLNACKNHQHLNQIKQTYGFQIEWFSMPPQIKHLKSPLFTTTRFAWIYNDNSLKRQQRWREKFDWGGWRERCGGSGERERCGGGVMERGSCESEVGNCEIMREGRRSA